KWGDLDERTEQLKDAGLIKNTLVGQVLTKDGKELQQFLINNKCELEAEMRRRIRRAPGSSGKYFKTGGNSQKMTSLHFTNRNRTIKLNDSSWTGDLAVP
ncbi:MAG: magnesium chelatase, partial [Clostridium sp.]|nr:magnesium chelatase [Clostridium sp.]